MGDGEIEDQVWGRVEKGNVSEKMMGRQTVIVKGK